MACHAAAAAGLQQADASASQHLHLLQSFAIQKLVITSAAAMMFLAVKLTGTG